jgi:hypothetical protein
MKKRLTAVAVAAVASLSIGMLAASAAPPIKEVDPCPGHPKVQFVAAGTTGDLNGDGRICVTDL